MRSAFGDDIESSNGNDTISSKWFWFVLDVTDLVEVELGLITGTAVEIEDDAGFDSGTFFFLGMAPVLLLGAVLASWDIRVVESSCTFVTVEDDVDSDEITAVVDILPSLFPIASAVVDMDAKSAVVDDSWFDLETLCLY